MSEWQTGCLNIRRPLRGLQGTSQSSVWWRHASLPCSEVPLVAGLWAARKLRIASQSLVYAFGAHACLVTRTHTGIFPLCIMTQPTSSYVNLGRHRSVLRLGHVEAAHHSGCLTVHDSNASSRAWCCSHCHSHALWALAARWYSCESGCPATPVLPTSLCAASYAACTYCRTHAPACAEQPKAQGSWPVHGRKTSSSMLRGQAVNGCALRILVFKHAGTTQRTGVGRPCQGGGGPGGQPGARWRAGLAGARRQPAPVGRGLRRLPGLARLGRHMPGAPGA